MVKPNPARPAPETANTSGQDAFSIAVGFVLSDRIEGGYVNDERDPGGETNFGISKRAYPHIDIKALTRETAMAIYRRDYWDTVRADELPPIIAIAAFDAAVNQGRDAAVRLLQRAVGVVTDGQLGPVTLKAVREADPDDLLVEYLGWRARRYHGTYNADTFFRGWMNRLLRLHAFAISNWGGAA